MIAITRDKAIELWNTEWTANDILNGDKAVYSQCMAWAISEWEYIENYANGGFFKFAWFSGTLKWDLPYSNIHDFSTCKNTWLCSYSISEEQRPLLPLEFKITTENETCFDVKIYDNRARFDNISLLPSQGKCLVTNGTGDTTEEAVVNEILNGSFGSFTIDVGSEEELIISITKIKQVETASSLYNIGINKNLEFGGLINPNIKKTKFMVRRSSIFTGSYTGYYNYAINTNFTSKLIISLNNEIIRFLINSLSILIDGNLIMSFII